MPTFDTPQPIAVSVELGAGDVRIAASDRRDTIVEVRPSDTARRSDVTAAAQTVVDCAGGTLLIRAPKRRLYTVLGPGRESVDVEISVPAGSSLRVDAGLAAIRCAGSLGECDIKTGFGDIVLDAGGPVHVRTGAGNITVDRALGRVEAKTGTGSVRIGAVEGPALIRNSNGDTWVGEVSGDLEVRAANGRIAVDRAGASVAARTACGDILLGEVGSGTVGANTSMGRVEVGIRRGVAAWLDLQTHAGKVLNELESAEPPEPGEDTVEVRARTPAGDITVRRS
ncbi:MAG TPA: DUF4097 family beta strand repeat-containing protein [Candidatus Binatia bacterium]|nr:DUF4097 family beta strand repeat-containing protein [Candidatus Binatia bacterium]